MKAEKRIRELEDAERACKAANESQRKTIVELESHCCVKTRGGEYWARQDQGGGRESGGGADVVPIGAAANPAASTKHATPSPAP